MKFIRIRTKSRKQFLETAKATYTHPDFPGQEVTLYGVAHIGEESYYRRIQGDLDTQDLVLYEFISAEESRPRRHRAPLHGVLAQILGLSSQMEALDYWKPNFVHADMTAAQLKARCGSKEMDELVSSIFSLPLELVRAVAKALKLAPVRWFALGLMRACSFTFRVNPTLSNRIKDRLAKMINVDDSWLKASDPEDPRSIILFERNKIVFDILQKRVAERSKKKIAVLYGAAHMTDLHNKLVESGWKLQDTQWLTVWRHRAPRPKVRIGRLVYSLPEGLPQGFGDYQSNNWS